MENSDLLLLFAKKRALVNEQEKLKQNLDALMEVIINDEFEKDWKTFPAVQIDRNNKLRSTCWAWKYRIVEIEWEIRNLDEDIKAQRFIIQEENRREVFKEIDEKLFLVVPDSKLRSHIKSLVGDLAFIQNDLLESIVCDPNLRKVLQDLKAIVTSIPKEVWRFLFFHGKSVRFPFFCKNEKTMDF